MANETSRLLNYSDKMPFANPITDLLPGIYLLSDTGGIFAIVKKAASFSKRPRLALGVMIPVSFLLLEHVGDVLRGLLLKFPKPALGLGDSFLEVLEVLLGVPDGPLCYLHQQLHRGHPDDPFSLKNLAVPLCGSDLRPHLLDTLLEGVEQGDHRAAVLVQFFDKLLGNRVPTGHGVVGMEPDALMVGDKFHMTGY